MRFKIKRRLIVTILSISYIIFWKIPAETSVISDDEPAKWFHETHGRRIGLLEWFDFSDIYYGRKLTKDDIWILKEGTTVFVTRERELSTVSITKHNIFFGGVVAYDVYDETGKYILIPQGMRISGPIDINTINGEVKLTITGNSFTEPYPGISLGLSNPTHLIPWIGPRFSSPDPAWIANILENPPLLAILSSSSKSDDAKAVSSKIQVMKNSEEELEIILPEIIEFDVKRALFFSAPWAEEYISKKKAFEQ
jgi:hypothetical protein